MSVIEILMQRDGDTYEDAKARFEDVKEEINCIIATGGTYDDIEEILASELELEMDYIFEFI